MERFKVWTFLKVNKNYKIRDFGSDDLAINIFMKNITFKLQKLFEKEFSFQQVEDTSDFIFRW